MPNAVRVEERQPDSAPPTLVARDLLEPQLLAKLGWDPEIKALVPPEHNPVFAFQVCAVVDCPNAMNGEGGFCTTCSKRWKSARATGTEHEAFLDEPSHNRRRWSQRLCRVCSIPGFRRVHRGWGLCREHIEQWHEVAAGGRPVTAVDFAGRADVRPLPTLGRCQVAGCGFVVDRPGETLCPYDRQRWTRHLQVHGIPPATREYQRWLRPVAVHRSRPRRLSPAGRPPARVAGSG